MTANTNMFSKTITSLSPLKSDFMKTFKQLVSIFESLTILIKPFRFAIFKLLQQEEEVFLPSLSKLKFLRTL